MTEHNLIDESVEEDNFGDTTFIPPRCAGKRVVEEGVQKLKQSSYDETSILLCLIILLKSLLYVPTTDEMPAPLLDAVAQQETFQVSSCTEARLLFAARVDGIVHRRMSALTPPPSSPGILDLIEVKRAAGDTRSVRM